MNVCFLRGQAVTEGFTAHAHGQAHGECCTNEGIKSHASLTACRPTDQPLLSNRSLPCCMLNWATTSPTLTEYIQLPYPLLPHVHALHLGFLRHFPPSSRSVSSPRICIVPGSHLLFPLSTRTKASIVPASSNSHPIAIKRPKLQPITILGPAT